MRQLALVTVAYGALAGLVRQPAEELAPGLVRETAKLLATERAEDSAGPTAQFIVVTLRIILLLCPLRLCRRLRRVQLARQVFQVVRFYSSCLSGWNGWYRAVFPAPPAVLKAGSLIT